MAKLVERFLKRVWGTAVLGILLAGCAAKQTDSISQPGSTLEPLTERKPSIAQLETFMQGLGDQALQPFISDSAQLLYDDLDGDGEDDLIVDDLLQVTVLMWAEKGYAKPFQIRCPYWKYDPSSRVALEDLTLDGVPEIVFDCRNDGGGTCVRSNEWWRNIIHCHGRTCNLAWSGSLGLLALDKNLRGMALRRAQIELRSDQLGKPELLHRTSGFVVCADACAADSVMSSELNRFGTMTVLSSTLSIYRWADSRFELADTQFLTSSYSIDDWPMSMSAVNEKGVVAQISRENAGFYQYACRLSVDGHPVGDPVECRPCFASVEWRDITNDGVTELVVTVLSQGSIEAGNRQGGCHLGQHLLAYSWDGGNANKIADVTGCVGDQDLFGVRLADLDGDGQFEIQASQGICTELDCRWGERNCWYELVSDISTRTYKWSGTEFVQWNQPRE